MMNQSMNSSMTSQDPSDTQKKKKIKAKPINGATEGTGAKRGRKKKVVEEKKCAKKKFGKKGVTVTSQAREIVYNVIKHFKVEAQNKCNSHPFDNWLKRSVAATGLSKSTLQRIIKEVEKPVAKMQAEEEPPPSHLHLQPPPPPVMTQHKEELPPVPHNHMHHNGEILVSQTLEAVRLEQYETGILKHFASNFMHHNLHHHNMSHHDLLLQPIHHAPIHQPPPGQPPPPHPPPTHHAHIHS